MKRAGVHHHLGARPSTLVQQPQLLPTRIGSRGKVNDIFLPAAQPVLYHVGHVSCTVGSCLQHASQAIRLRVCIISSL
jgi:hypothetical protein